MPLVPPAIESSKPTIRLLGLPGSKTRSRTAVFRPPLGPLMLSFVHEGAPLIALSQRNRPRGLAFGPNPPPPLIPPMPDPVATKIVLSSVGLTRIFVTDRLLARKFPGVLVAELYGPSNVGFVLAFLMT